MREWRAHRECAGEVWVCGLLRTVKVAAVLVGRAAGWLMSAVSLGVARSWLPRQARQTVARLGPLCSQTLTSPISERGIFGGPREPLVALQISQSKLKGLGGLAQG